MNGNKEFGTGVLYKATSYIYFFMMTNVYFILSNLLFIVCIIMLEPVLSNSLFYLLAIMLTGPSMTALCCCIMKYIAREECNPLKDYFTFYRKNFFDTLKTWLPVCVIGFILLVDVQYVHLEHPIFSIIFKTLLLLLFIILSLVSSYMFFINAKFSFRTIDIYKLSIFYTLTKIKVTLGNAGILFITLFVMYQYSDFLIFFVASPLCFLLIKNSYTILDNVQEQFVQK